MIAYINIRIIAKAFNSILLLLLLLLCDVRVILLLYWPEYLASEFKGLLVMYPPSRRGVCYLLVFYSSRFSLM